MHNQTLVQFTSFFSETVFYSIMKTDDGFILLNTKTGEFENLVPVDLIILYYGISDFFAKVANGFYGPSNIENTPHTIDINGKYSLVIYKGTIDNYSNAFTSGSTSADNIEFTSVSAWKIELYRTEDNCLLGDTCEKNYKFLPYTTPVMFNVLNEYLEHYLKENNLC